MQGTKLILGTTIIITGIAVSILIIGILDNGGNTHVSEASLGSTSANPDIFFQFESNNRDTDSIVLSTSTPADYSEQMRENGNLTDKLANTYAAYLMTNEDSPILPKEIGEAMAKEINKPLSHNLFSIDDILTIENNSQEKKLAYLELLDELLWKHFGKFKNENTHTAIKEMFENDNPSVLEGIMKAAPDYIGDMLTIEAPSEWKEIHLQLVNVWKKKLSLYKAILDYNNDPLRAYLAIQELPSVVYEDAELNRIIRTYHEAIKSSQNG